MLSGPGGSARRLTGQSNGAGRALGDGCTGEKYSRRSQPPPMVCIVHINRGGGPTCIHLAKHQVESRPPAATTEAQCRRGARRTGTVPCWLSVGAGGRRTRRS